MLPSVGTTATALEMSTFGASQWRLVLRWLSRSTSRSIIARKPLDVLEIAVGGTPMVGALRTSGARLMILLQSKDTMKLPGRGIFLPAGEMLFNPYVT